jgi:DNA-binding CsgD family transcriptional regulator
MNALLADAAVLELIEHVYAAGCDPTEWQTLVSRVHEALPGTSTTIHLNLEGTTLAGHSASAGFSDESLKSYFEHYQFINPYVPLFANMPVGKVHTVGGTIDRAWVKQQPFYHEWLKPAGNFTHGAGLVVMRDDKRLLYLTLDIPERLGHLEDPAADLLKRLGPHLSRAFTVNEKFAATTATQHALSALVDTMDAPAGIVDDSGKVIVLNAEAEELLRIGGFVRSGSGNRLQFVDPGHDAQYRHLLASTCDPKSVDGRTAFRAEASNGIAHQILVLPLRPATIIGMVSAGAWALVVLRNAAARPTLPEHILKTLYGLTPAEAGIAMDLALGLSGEEIADKNRLSKLTVRNQIASTMAKMGVHRQAQLVSTVLGLLPRLGRNSRNGK